MTKKKQTKPGRFLLFFFNSGFSNVDVGKDKA